MALRVLLADESTTIKKVMQLALQDFAVEVKSVHSGLDVVEVARSFVPDIIFADVLLQKKNGYEVCAELKRDPSLKTIPLVLMWSSFMDLDEKQASMAQANRRLEKPFDVESLRQLVMELVPKTRSQRLAHFLQYPESFVQPLREEVLQKAPQKPPPLPPKTASTIAAPTATAVEKTSTPASRSSVAPNRVENELESSGPPAGSAWNMDSFEDINAFSQRELDDDPENEDEDDSSSDETFSELRIVPSAPANPDPEVIDFNNPVNETADVVLEDEPRSGDDRDPWSHQDLSRFKLDLDPMGTAAEIDLESVENDLGEIGGEIGGEIRLDIERGKVEDHENVIELELPPFNAGDAAEIDFSSPGTNSPGAKKRGEPVSPSRSQTMPSTIPSLSADQLERIVRAQSREIIETLVRRIVPDLATQIIRAELKRLLEDSADSSDELENLS